MTAADRERASYRVGYDYGRRFLRAGAHPDALRFAWSSVEEVQGEPFGPAAWRGLEDALAGRPCAP